MEYKAWLLTWNPAYWDVENYQEICAKSKEGVTWTERWNVSSKQPELGDDVFLMKMGDAPKGIVAHGRVVKTAYSAPHYMKEKAAAGEMLEYIDVEFDKLQYYPEETILLLDDLKRAYPTQLWSPRASGIGIKDSVYGSLLNVWDYLTASH